jgi:putative SOS response-associated peptidase YedK
MCGRFSLALKDSGRSLIEAFKLAQASDLEPRYNIAPTQYIAAVLETPEQPRHLTLLKWGLIPSWAKDQSFATRMINARSETVTEKPAFRGSFKRKRCLIPATGFYEWQAVSNADQIAKQGRKTKKQPYYIHLQSNRPFGFAGLWSEWTDKTTGEVIDSCTILTTAANELMQTIHDRMPVIIEPEDYDTWLDPTLDDRGVLMHLLRPYPAEHMAMYPVSTIVNKATHDSADCLEAIDAGSMLK